MTIRSLGLAVFLVSMAAACQQKMAPTDEPADGDSTAKSDDTTMPAGDDKAKDKPADAPAKTDAPAQTDNTKTTAPAPAPTGDAQKDATPEDIGTCFAECRDPASCSKCVGTFGGGDNPFGF